MSTFTKLHTATVTITYVQQSRTRGTWARPDGLKRWVIGAENIHGESLGERLIGLTTLDPLKASLCDRARQSGQRLLIKYRRTKWFDSDLLYVELAKEQAATA